MKGSNVFKLFTSQRECFKVQKRFRSNLWKELQSRGLLKDCIPQNREEEIAKSLTSNQVVYAGFDPTGPSLHIGNLLVISNLLRALRSGHKVICVIGDATASIGDPSGRIKARDAIEKKTLLENSSRISSQINSIFSNHFKHFWKPFNTTTLSDPVILANSNWYKEKNYIEFLQEVGNCFNMRNLTRKSFVEDKSRNLTYAEFSYQIMQAYDWLYLHDKYKCNYQFGGIDQTHNIEAGVSLVKHARQRDVYGLFLPLLTDKDGQKMGKTEGQSIFLDRFILCPFLFYQKILKIPHSHVECFLNYFTYYQPSEIEAIISKGLKRGSFYGQERLAEFLTLLVHGESGLNQALNVRKALLSNQYQALENLTQDDLFEVFGESLIQIAEFKPDVTSVFDVVGLTKCFSDPKLAASMIEEGGVIINDKLMRDPQELLSDDFILANNLTLVRIGTKRAYIIQWM